jgi:two-component system, OmpR family, sensor histidine kinase QseC
LSARLVLASMPPEVLAAPSLSRFEVPGMSEEDRRQLYFQIWELGPPGTAARAMRLVHSSGNLPALFSGPMSPELKEGFSTQCSPSECWRVFGLRDAKQRVIVFSASPRTQLDEAVITTVLGAFAWTFAVYLPLLALAGWIATRWSLKPLREAAKDLERRADNDAAPVPATAMPSEVRPFVDAINKVLTRLAEAREAERAFIADAAHELRTPLAALRAQVQVAMRASSESERLDRLARVQEGIDRTTRLAVQLLDLARADAFDVTGRRQTIDLGECARIAISELEDRAALHGVKLLGTLDTAYTTGNNDLLTTLTRNLIDNALRHGASGGRVEVETRTEVDNAVLEVRDHGPGIAPEARAGVFERFARGERLRTADDESGLEEQSAGDAQSESRGVGLGLAIVKRIVDAHGGHIELDATTEKGGLRVVIVLPRGDGNAGPDA